MQVEYTFRIEKKYTGGLKFPVQTFGSYNTHQENDFYVENRKHNPLNLVKSTKFHAPNQTGIFVYNFYFNISANIILIF